MNLREFVISIKLKMAEARGRLGELKGEFSKAAEAAKDSGSKIEDAGNKAEKAFDNAAAAAEDATKANKENTESIKENADTVDKATASWGGFSKIAGSVIGSISKGFKGLNIPTSAVKDFNKELTRLKSSSTPLGMLTKGFLGLGAAALGARGLMEFFANTVNNDAMLGRTSRSIGSTPTNLNAWGTAFQGSGGTQQDAAQSIGHLQDAFTSYKMTGSMQGINEGAMLKLLGVNYRQKMAGGAEQTMYALAGASKNFSAPEYSWLLRQLGLNESAVAVLSKGEPSLKQLIEDAKRAHDITVENTKAAQDLQEAWAKFENSSKGVFAPLIRGLEEALASELKLEDAANKAETESSGEQIKQRMQDKIGAMPVKGSDTEERVKHNSYLYSQDELHLANRNVQTGFLAEMRRSLFGANDQEKIAIDAMDKLREMKEAQPKASTNNSNNSSDQAVTFSTIKGFYDKAQQSKKGGGHTALDMNNPGGIVDGDFAKRMPGYIGSDGHFAQYRSLEDGIGAMRRLLKSGYLDKGYDTPHRIAYKWASGRNDNPELYAEKIKQKTGIDKDEHIDSSQLELLIRAMAGNENSGVNSGGGGFGGGFGGGIQNHFHGDFVFTGSSGNSAQDHAREFTHEVNKQFRASSFNTGQD